MGMKPVRPTLMCLNCETGLIPQVISIYLVVLIVLYSLLVCIVIVYALVSYYRKIFKPIFVIQYWLNFMLDGLNVMD